VVAAARVARVARFIVVVPPVELGGRPLPGPSQDRPRRPAA